MGEIKHLGETRLLLCKINFCMWERCLPFKQYVLFSKVAAKLLDPNFSDLELYFKNEEEQVVKDNFMAVESADI